MTSEEKQLREWIEKYSGKLLNRAFYMVSNREEAQDLVQEVFLSAYSSMSKFESKSSVLTWLYQILNHKISDFYRKKYKSIGNISLDSFFDETGFWENNDVLESWESDSAENEIGIEETLQKCLEELPAKWKIPIKLYYIQQKKTKEICQETGISSTNLWKIFQRSRLQLRECIEINWFEKDR